MSAATFDRAPSAPIRYFARIVYREPGEPVQDVDVDAVGVLGVREVLGGEAGLRAAHRRVADQDRLQVGLRDVDGQAGRRELVVGLPGGVVPQVWIRPISSPAIEVQNTVSPISSCSVASAST